MRFFILLILWWAVVGTIFWMMYEPPICVLSGVEMGTSEA